MARPIPRFAPEIKMTRPLGGSKDELIITGPRCSAEVPPAHVLDHGALELQRR